tara:strand:+ start:745 stop:1269 length:525 start_codon:yes stop_codon:yes gene_type:complete
MADGRRIIFSSHVTPIETDTLEEAAIGKSSLWQSVNKSLGSKSTVTDLNTNQSKNGWTSMIHTQATWEYQYDEWETNGGAWSGDISLTAGADGLQLTSGVSALVSQDVSFLYLKNTGATNVLRISLDGLSGSYYIKVPPGGSVALRGGDSSFHCNDIYVKSTDGTTLEWVLAHK